MMSTVKQAAFTINGCDFIRSKSQSLASTRRISLLPPLPAMKSRRSSGVSVSKPVFVSSVESFGGLKRSNEKTDSGLVKCKAYEADRAEPMEGPESKAELAYQTSFLSFVQLIYQENNKMEKTLSLVLILPLLIMLLLVGTHAKIIIESPAPQPQPPNTLPMNGTTPGSLHPQDCLPKCTYRCSNTQYRKPCMFFCQKCCAKCLCVPAGTYGNKQFCPCYNNWKTKRGGPKCP